MIGKGRRGIQCDVFIGKRRKDFGIRRINVADFGNADVFALRKQDPCGGNVENKRLGKGTFRQMPRIFAERNTGTAGAVIDSRDGILRQRTRAERENHIVDLRRGDIHAGKSASRKRWSD